MGAIPGLRTVETYTPVEIRAFQGDYLIIPCTIAEGENLNVGQLLGEDTGKYVAYDPDVNTAKGILAEKVDATDADVISTMYVKGSFVEARLTGLDDAAKEALNAKSVGGILII